MPSRRDPTHLRDRKIDREIEATLRLAHSGARIPAVPNAAFGVRQPWTGRRDHKVPDEPSVPVCVWVPPPYPQRPLELRVNIKFTYQTKEIGNEAPDLAALS